MSVKRHAARIARAAARAMPGALAKDGQGLWILAYHLVGGRSPSPVDIPRETFRRQMEELRRTALPCSLDEGVRRVTTGDPADRPLVAVTFDDAYDNFRTEAWPVLSEFEIPVTLFVPVDFIDGTGPAPIRGTGTLAPLTWAALDTMIRSPLLSVGSHSVSHPDLRRLPDGDLERELVESKTRLEARLDCRIEAFCYPRGFFDSRVAAATARTYSYAVTGGGRRNRARSFDPFRLQRLPIRTDTPAALEPILRRDVWPEEWLLSRLRAVAG
jgi:peptidoglycan/xylan/chitin deacetylase (PgdA/CDA1 family)